ncbi:MAG: LytTR family DNA-binding domain-containing protein [Bacteroidota bacterium]|nr:LytTR family DNA-binding domain-containing protein [Bacteroidota bacterium]MDP4216681.1 LytTR family DNA-binding domain-containing protein [Bacteroidota bacterium]MDP4244215.1 LytTR family DNA-binding domain-containing protein [Bacteroidota bacterium]MDP4253413.1 LytTR family DNA-binding domain-containing protein [Bacteroidota bacterium]MDP4258875.1 LytTR family DNA-binding domain-containing protein [Bacteroidota bacterium]
MKLRCIIVDDEPVARKGMAEELKEIAFLELVGIGENAYQAMDLVATLHPDLIFLDIEMPGLNGLDLIRTLRQPPMIIVTTAYPEYALKGYELDVMDYLIKPVDFNRLLKACCKAQEFHALRQRATGSAGPVRVPADAIPAGPIQTILTPTVPALQAEEGYFFVKANGKYEKLLFKELLYVEAADNYVLIYTGTKKLMVYDTLKNMESLLPPDRFMKVHKSYLVALDKVSVVEGGMLRIANAMIPVSRNLKEAVLGRILKS